jgi:hypothetical protein
MSYSLLRAGLITAALAVAPTLLVAQEAASGAAAPAAAAPAAAPTEAEQITARLAKLQQQAAQDPKVLAAYAGITTATEAAVPEYRVIAERAGTIRADIAAAQAAKDNVKLRALATEAGELQAKAQTARAAANANAEVQAKTLAYRTVLFKKMVEIDPEAQKLVARLAELKK